MNEPLKKSSIPNELFKKALLPILVPGLVSGIVAGAISSCNITRQINAARHDQAIQHKHSVYEQLIANLPDIVAVQYLFDIEKCEEEENKGGEELYTLFKPSQYNKQSVLAYISQAKMIAGPRLAKPLDELEVLIDSPMEEGKIVFSRAKIDRHIISHTVCMDAWTYYMSQVWSIYQDVRVAVQQELSE